ncbi:MAG TPA: NAD(P)-dependent alcohol dehydrogenase [Candidatus Acidoferrales bacterium]|jgi:NADPH:quinone reductase-like Zn-dependent oxidoreductase|nr:NAD(P)-dependent alcohol dehydrogenase [Candidatus Acidoferrales bacterium]
MKAIVCHRYGSPDVLECEEMEVPIAGDDEVLIKVRAASVNPLDGGSMKGRPYIVRLLTGLRKPKITRPGVDVAGQVKAVGRHVTQFKPGDEVFGVCISDPQASGTEVWSHRQGAFAEYVCAPESMLAIKPDNVTFEEAAAVPVAAFTALQGLRDKGQIQPGQKVLINGASGGVGTIAVQIGKSFGAEVTGVCSTRNMDMVRSIGADYVIDYTQEDFTKRGQRYDLIFDCVGNHSLSACRRVLGPEGICILVGQLSGRGMISILARLMAALVLSRLVSQKLVMVLARPNKRDLTIMHELLKAGKVTPVIDKRYSLGEVPEAIRYLEEKHARGKVVVTLE